MKSKGESERYIQLSTEFQKTARKYKKDFFNEQCLIIEENNKRGKTRDLFRKTGNKGTFHPKMGTIMLEIYRSRRDQEEMERIHRITI